MLIVTGASGQLGRAVVNKLLGLVPADQIGVSVRDPAKVGDLIARGVRVRAGDFANSASLAHAFEGATRVLVVSSNAAATGGDPLAQHRNAIEAARTAGAQHLFYTSHAAADADSAFPPARDHAATEAMLHDAGVPWTAFRHGFYAESAPMLMGDWRKTGVVVAPADGKVAWTTHADLAEADALLMAREDPPQGPTAPLTGPEALDLADLAMLAGELTGDHVRRELLPDAAMAERMAARGAPASAATIALGLYLASRNGEFATVDPALGRLLGRGPTDMRMVLGEMLLPQTRTQQGDPA